MNISTKRKKKTCRNSTNPSEQFAVQLASRKQTLLVIFLLQLSKLDHEID